MNQDLIDLNNALTYLYLLIDINKDYCKLTTEQMSYEQMEKLVFKISINIRRILPYGIDETKEINLKKDGIMLLKNISSLL